MLDAALRRMVACVIALITLVIVSPAFADICRSIRAELATMQPAQDQRRIAAQASAEMARLGAHMRSIGCDRQSFLIFGQPAPAECGSYRARMAQLQSYASAGESGAGRRHQLMAMLDNYNCNARSRAPLTAGIFDDGSRRTSLEIRPASPIDPEPVPRIVARIRGVGGKAVCVRLCDGFYFPLDAREGSLRETGDDTCQSLCPAAETKVYLKPGEIETARNLEGENYTALPNALRYRKAFDATCTCREPGETVGSQVPKVLNPDGVSLGEGFGILNQDEAAVQEDLPLRGSTTDSIAKGAERSTERGKKPTSLFGKEKLPQPPSPPQGPPEIPADQLVAAGVGEIREFPLTDGSMRKVRVIGREHAGVPAAAAVPSVPAHDPAP